MIKLESYMEEGSFTATFFYVEVEGRPEDRPVARAFDELHCFSEKFEILGVYPADPFRSRA
jgi:prephenate dehydratase